jgi:hypothetical protein
MVSIVLAGVMWWLGLHLLNVYSATPTLAKRVIGCAVALLACALWIGIEAVSTPTPNLVLVPVLTLLLSGVSLAVLIRELRIHEQNVWLPLFRSLDVALTISCIFGIQILVIAAVAELTELITLRLLLSVVFTAIFIPMFAVQWQAAFDRFAFGRFPLLWKARAELRATAEALPVGMDLSIPHPETELLTLDSVEFYRLTRRALSYLGDLPKLATSPLIHLPAIDTRLHQRNAHDDVLERAVELKKLLTESIVRLKPHSSAPFGVSPEWRHYNALYFPYVVGLRPYTVQTRLEPFEPLHQEALIWFQQEVPERTLHNWQTAAARLIAEDLRPSAA